MALSAADLIRMSRLLDEALPLDAAGRQAWLDALAAQHRDLAPALRNALLTGSGEIRQQESLAAILGVGPGIAARNAEESDSLDAGKIVGPYRLIRELGRGGMGSVWLGKRTDGTLKRQVALKLPHSNLARSQLAERFARERDILATLVHAHIARLYDAGVTAEGQPYLALEYVEGEAITTWCDARKLGIAERLTLFQQVLAAVQYAHRQNVIHRDLKPPNILVTTDGEVRLLDFGIAKLMTDGEAHETALTEVGGRALSPQYASPEQVQGKALGAGSDVYSLGVVLHELLTGSLPYQMTRGSRAALEEAILSVEPTKPSASDINPTTAAARNATPKEILTTLKGSLDSILHKALKKNPNERYDSAKALADDIERYLKGQEVGAKPEAMSSKATKLIRQNRTAVGAVAVVAVMMLVGIMSWQSKQQANSESAQPAPAVLVPAIIISEKSVAVLPFVDMSEKKDQEYFSDGLSEELIGLLSKVPGLHVPARTSSFYFKGKPTKITDIAKELSVANVLEGSVRKSGKQLRITVQLIRAESGDHLWSETYERKLNDIFKIQDDIAVEVVKALKVSLLVEAMPKVKGTQSQEAYNLYLQARSQYHQVSTQSGDEKAIDSLQKMLKLDPHFAPAWATLALFHVAEFDMYMTRPFAEARADANGAAEQALRLDPQLADAHVAKGRVLYVFDWSWDKALAQYQEAIALDPANAIALRHAGLAACTLGRLDQGLQLILSAVARDPLDPWNYWILGELRYRHGELKEAETARRKFLEIASTGQKSAHYNLGLVLLAEDQTVAALAEMEREVSPKVRQQGLALALDRLGRKSEADAALAIAEDKYGADEAYRIALVYANRKDLDRAFAWLDRAYRQHDPALNFVKGDPLLKNLESDPRYKAFLRKMKLPE
jgi:serine/threonine protein kinase/TolB-like protein